MISESQALKFAISYNEEYVNINKKFLSRIYPNGLVYTGYTPMAPGRVAQSVTCLATDACLTADPGVVSSIPAWSHTFVEIDHEIISTLILLPLIHSRRVVVSYKESMCTNYWLTACSSLPRKKCG